MAATPSTAPTMAHSGSEFFRESQTLPVDVSLPKELEVCLAEMETRVRASVLRVLRPALDQLLENDARLQDVSKKINDHEIKLDEVDKLRKESDRNYAQIQAVEGKGQKLEEQVCNFEQRMKDYTSKTTHELTHHSHRLQDHQQWITKLSREASSIWQETTRLQQQHQEASDKASSDLASMAKRLDSVKEDLQFPIRQLQRQREELLLDVFEGDRGINKIFEDLKTLQQSVSPIPALKDSIAATIEGFKKLEEKQEHLAKELAESKVACEEVLSAQVAAKDNDKSEFKEICNRLVAHTAENIRAIRNDYQSEFGAIRDMKKEIALMIQNADQSCKSLEEKLHRETRRIDALHREFIQDIEELHTKRKKDRLRFDTEALQVRQDLTEEKAHGAKLRSYFDFMTRIFGLVLEAGRVATSLHTQDFADRCLERWVTLPADRPSGPAAPLKATELEKSRQRREEMGFKAVEEYPRDVRSGVVRGGYQPGKVVYSGQAFDRRDLIILMNGLLTKAQSSFLAGPQAAEAVQVTSELSRAKPAAAKSKKVLLQNESDETEYEVPMQPGANGGMSAEQVNSRGPVTEVTFASQGKTKDVPEHILPSKAKVLSDYGPSPPTSSTGIRQRPGSKGQPQAIGSRGTMLGSLGETIPAPRIPADPLKLPSIKSVAQSQAMPNTGRRNYHPTTPIDKRLGSMTAR